MNIQTVTDLAIRTGGVFIILDIGSNGGSSRIRVLGDIFPTEVLNLVDEGAHAIEFDTAGNARETFNLAARALADDHTLLFGTVTIVEPGRDPVSFDIDEDAEFPIVADGGIETIPVFDKIGA